MLNRIPAAGERARTAIAEGRSLINKGQKLIKIADCSEHGSAPRRRRRMRGG